jgi:chemotaxis protein CheX
MKAEFINPFISSLVNILKTMAGVEAKIGKPFLKNQFSAYGDVTAMIGIAGKTARGYLALSFPTPVMTQIASKILREEYTQLDPIVVDMCGELSNMVMGNVKETFSTMGYDFGLSTPSTITGTPHVLYSKSPYPSILIPFETEFGQFFMEVCMGV